MNTWQKWIKRPQTVWLRKALFQVHLWSGIALGLYVVAVCLSGSIAVFNSELYSAFLPQPKTVEIAGTRLSRDQLLAIARQAHPRAAITRVQIFQNPREAAVVSLGAATYADQRYLDPYTGKDLGTARPMGLRMVSFFSALHMNLLMGYSGRLINGVGGVLVALLSMTGMVIWWPGIRRWGRALIVRPGTNFKRLNWDLHSALGFWTFAIVFMWAITGAYLVFPKPFDTMLGKVPTAALLSNVGLLRSLHVGDFGGWPVKALYVLLGIAPPILFITGFIMWWYRVLNPWRKRALARPPRVRELSLNLPGRAFEFEREGSGAALEIKRL